MDLFDLQWWLHGRIPVGSTGLGVSEVLGNAFGLASAILGMRRTVWAWPVGIVGNVLLFTVFVSGNLSAGGTDAPLWGQAGRQILFAAVSLYGWWRWRSRESHADGAAVQPRWASWTQRAQLLAIAVIGYAVAYPTVQALGSWGPATEAWILVGSALATYGMARGWVEFWLVWLLVDAVGVWSLLHAGYYPTAGMYLFYAGFVVAGFVTWWRVSARNEARAEDLVGVSK